jgi:hypothetical protein
MQGKAAVDLGGRQVHRRRTENGAIQFVSDRCAIRQAFDCHCGSRQIVGIASGHAD